MPAIESISWPPTWAGSRPLERRQDGSPTIEPVTKPEPTDPDSTPFDSEEDSRVPDDILYVCAMHKDSRPMVLVGMFKDWKLPDVPRLLLRLYNTPGERAAIQFIENGWKFYMDCMDPQSKNHPREVPPTPPANTTPTVINPRTTTVEDFRRTCGEIFEEATHE